MTVRTQSWLARVLIRLIRGQVPVDRYYWITSLTISSVNDRLGRTVEGRILEAPLRGG
jgi:hypothetical protein